MQLTEHLTLEAMTTNGKHPSIDNTPPDNLLQNIRRTAQKVEEAFEILGKALNQEVIPRVSYGYRCPALNKAVGSVSRTSAHLEGSAADMQVLGTITPRRFWDALRLHSTFMIGVDQLIIERGCVHLGLPVAAHNLVAREELRTEAMGPDGIHYLLYGIWSGGAK
jgi:hypothetical protein